MYWFTRYDFRIPHYEDRPKIEPHHIKLERRIAIGAQVIGIWFMTDASLYLENMEDKIVFTSAYDTSAKRFMALVSEQELELARQRLMTGKPGSNIHIAANQMGLATKTFLTDFGNQRFQVNADFVVASHYVEDALYAQKIDAELSISALINQTGSDLRKFYIDRATPKIDQLREDTDLRELVLYTTRDSEYWLDQ